MFLELYLRFVCLFFEFKKRYLDSGCSLTPIIVLNGDNLKELNERFGEPIDAIIQFDSHDIAQNLLYIDDFTPFIETLLPVSRDRWAAISPV